MRKEGSKWSNGKKARKSFPKAPKRKHSGQNGIDHRNIKENNTDSVLSYKNVLFVFHIVMKAGLILAVLFRSCVCGPGNDRVQEQAAGGN